MIGAASFGGTALVLGCGLVLLLAVENPASFEPSGWLYVLAGTTLGAATGATEADRLASQDSGGTLRVAVLASLAALVLLAAVVAVEAALGTSGVVRSLTSAQEAFAGMIGAGLVCGSVLYFPVFLLWGAVSVSAFRLALGRFGHRAV